MLLLPSAPADRSGRYGHLEATTTLVKHGADLEIADVQGYTALHLAAQHGFPAVIAYLLARDSVADHTDPQGLTALHWSAKKAFECGSPACPPPRPPTDRRAAAPTAPGCSSRWGPR